MNINIPRLVTDAQREHAERVRVLMGGVGLIREDEGQHSDLLVIIGKDYEIPDLL